MDIIEPKLNGQSENRNDKSPAGVRNDCRGFFFTLKEPSKSRAEEII